MATPITSSPQRSANTGDVGTRDKIALFVVAGSFVIVLFFGLAFVYFDDDLDPMLNTIMPLLGTWMGAILAFYFTKENFEAAQRAVNDLALRTPAEEKLRVIPVTQVMRKLSPTETHYEVLHGPASSLTLTAIKDRANSAGKGERIPIVSEETTPLYMLHLSLLEKFLNDLLINDQETDVAALSLQDMLNVSEYKNLLEKSWATVREDASLADAKREMERTTHCQDVFVTVDGARSSQVCGWITNHTIIRHSRP